MRKCFSQVQPDLCPGQFIEFKLICLPGTDEQGLARSVHSKLVHVQGRVGEEEQSNAFEWDHPPV